MVDRCLVFCTADIPTTVSQVVLCDFLSQSLLQTIDLLLQCSEKYLSEFESNPDISEHIVIIDTKDITTITEGSSPTSFLGYTLQQVCDWFDANITQPQPEGFMTHCFLVLDDKSIEEETCFVVSNLDSAPGEIHSLRCTFDLGLQVAVVNHHGGDSFEEGSWGNFMRSGVTMTNENVKLVESNGCYIEGGEVKVDQAWRDFCQW
jgi:hypothetical protein